VLPLQSGDRELILNLQPLLNRIYARARYYLAIDYNQEPIPPLKAEDKAWADTLLRELGTLGLRDLKRGKGTHGKNHYQCPMPNAQCPMPNAQCPMPNAQCPMPNAQCPMPNAQCPMPNSQSKIL
jgi:hypothetical protein